MFQKKVSEKDYRFSIGQIVRIRSKEEILKSLDISNKFKGCLFMNQMWDYSGKEFKVLKVMSYFFDEYQYKMYKTRSPLCILENLICKGIIDNLTKQCDRSCYLFWHEDWLEAKFHSSNNQIKNKPVTNHSSTNQKAVKNITDRESIISCQLTNIHEIARGNSLISDIFQLIINKSKALIKKFVLYLKDKTSKFVIFIKKNGYESRPENLIIQPGDIVKVKSKGEIQRILDKHGKYKGCSFIREMYDHCDKKYKVYKKIHYFYDEASREMCSCKNILILENVTCSGRQRLYSMNCNRNCFLFWRVSWLEKVR